MTVENRGHFNIYADILQSKMPMRNGYIQLSLRSDMYYSVFHFYTFNGTLVFTMRHISVLSVLKLQQIG